MTRKRNTPKCAVTRRSVMTMAATFIVYHLSLTISPAQTVRQAFTSMPDSLMPMLTTNNRLDMIDFMDAKMKATVDNKLNGESTMTFLGEDSLAVTMSEALTVEMKMLKEGNDSIASMKRTYRTRNGERQVTVTHYNPKTWEEISATTTESTLLRRDDKVEPANNVYDF